jgi:Zn-dependent protease
METLFSIIILIFSVVIHEVAHGYAALQFGDSTARYAGRLTLNPIAHIDWFGSVLLPLLLVLSHAGFVIGWAKPVPVNPYNFSHRRLGEGVVAAAGPLANLLLALCFGLLIRFIGPTLALPASFIDLAAIVVITNIVLAVFNLLPLPPLDGSKILFTILPNRFSRLRDGLERQGIFLVLIFIFFFWQTIYPLVPFLFSLITGFHL